MPFRERVLTFILYWWFFLFGVEFYETLTDPQDAEIYQVDFEASIPSQNVRFRFYRETYFHHTYQLGRFVPHVSYAFIIASFIPNNDRPGVEKMNKTRYFFPSRLSHWVGERIVVDVLLRVHLRFLKHTLKH